MTNPADQNPPSEIKHPSPDSHQEWLQAVGLVCVRQEPSGEKLVAVLERRGTWCLPRVVCFESEPDQAAMGRALRSQVGASFEESTATFLVTLSTRLGDRNLRTGYWRIDCEGDKELAHPALDWLNWSEAIRRIDLPEESRLLATMEDPLAQPPHKKSAPAVPLDSYSDSYKEGPKTQATRSGKASYQNRELGAAIDAAQESLYESGGTSDWRSRAQEHLQRAKEAFEAGRDSQAQAAWAAAWKLEFESRSVGERRLWTRLLQGEVRARTLGWKRDALLGALEESPDAATLALVRTELQGEGLRSQEFQRGRSIARLVQLILVIPVVITLFLLTSQQWLEGEFPPSGQLLPSALCLGLLGGLTWSVLRQTPKDVLGAIAPLAAGAFGAFFGFLLGRADILSMGQGSAPASLCMAVLWGLAAAALLEFRRPGAPSGPPAE